MRNHVSLLRKGISVSVIVQSVSQGKGAITSKLSISLVVGILLALSGGFMDAYSYVGRGGVFANAQTGNMVLLGIHLSQGHFEQSIIYAIPILMFLVGIALAEVFRIFEHSLKWQHVSLIVEIGAFIIVSTLSADCDLLANVLVSFVCGIQFESFRRIHGNAMTTTVCMGNMRNATQLFVESIEHRSVQKLKGSFLYLFITLCFVLGAVIGYFSVMMWNRRAIYVCVGLVSMALMSMLLHEREVLHLRDL